jgi:hypothetical protein
MAVAVANAVLIIAHLNAIAVTDTVTEPSLNSLKFIESRALIGS